MDKTNTVIIGLCQDVHVIHATSSLIKKGFDVVVFDSAKYSPGLKVRGIKDKFVNKEIENDDRSFVNLLKQIGAKYPGSILLTGDDRTSYIISKYQKDLTNFRFLTIDFDTLEDMSVTVRDRDSMEQERVKLDELESYLGEKLS